MPLCDITNDIKRAQLKTKTHVRSDDNPTRKIALDTSLPNPLAHVEFGKLEGDIGETNIESKSRSSSTSMARSIEDSDERFSGVSVEQPLEHFLEPSLSDCRFDAGEGYSCGDYDFDEEKIGRKEEVEDEEVEEEEKVINKRQSRRQKKEPERLGDLLEWHCVNTHQLFEKFDPGREQKIVECVKLEKERLRKIREREIGDASRPASGESGRAVVQKKQSAKQVPASALNEARETNDGDCEFLRGGQQSKAVLDVHQRVADLMRMAEEMLPPEEPEECDDGLPKKSIREKLRDAWDGDGYYAKLMKEQESTASSSSSSSSKNSSSNDSNQQLTKKTVQTTTTTTTKDVKVYCDKENPVAHKANRGGKKNNGGGAGLGIGGCAAATAGASNKQLVGCGGSSSSLSGGGSALVQRTALTTALGTVNGSSSSTSSQNTINNSNNSGGLLGGYMFGNLKSIQAPQSTTPSATTMNTTTSSAGSISSSNSIAACSSDQSQSETLQALKAENELLRKQRNDIKIQQIKMKKDFDELKKNARIAVSKLCARLPNNSRGVELDALAFLKLN